MRLLFIISLILLFSCNSAKQAQKFWYKGVSKNVAVYVVNSQKLAKQYYKDFASFCHEFYPAIINNDSTDYLMAKSKYDNLQKIYAMEKSELLKKIETSDSLYKAARLAGDDSAAIVQLEDKVQYWKQLYNKCNDNEPKDLPPIKVGVKDSALQIAYSNLDIEFTKITAQKEAAEKRLNQLENAREGKVLLAWWWFVVAGVVVAGLLILLIKK